MSMDSSRHAWSNISKAFNAEAKSKRTCPSPDEPDNFKKLRTVDQNIQQATAELKVYRPISSLSPAVTCPAIKATVISTGEWSTYSRVCCMKFQLRDESGEIAGIVYEPMSAEFKKNFTVQAEVIIERPLIQPLRTGSTQYQVVVNKRTAIKVLRTPVEKVAPDPAPPSLEAKPAIPGKKWTSIKTIIESISDRTLVDVMGIVVEVQQLYNFTTRFGRLTLRRDVRITDESNETITVSLWEEKASNFNSPVGVVIVMNQIAVRQYPKEKNLTACKQTEIIINPPTAEAHRLKIWYKPSTKHETPRNISIGQSDSSKTTETSVTGSETSLSSNESRANVSSTPILSDNPEPVEKKEFPLEVPKSTERRRCEVPSRNAQTTGRDITAALLAAISAPAPVELVSLSEIESYIDADTAVDFVGRVVEAEGWKLRKTHNGTDQYMREITLTEGFTKIGLTIYTRAKDCTPITSNSVLLLKKAAVIMVGKKKKLTCLLSRVTVDPDIPQAQRLKKLPPMITFGSTVCNQFPTFCEIIDNICEESTVDVIGIVDDWRYLGFRCQKAEKNYLTADIQLRHDDDILDLAIHGTSFDADTFPINAVLVIKNATVVLDKFKKGLSCWKSNITVDPDIPETHRLKKLVRPADYSDVKEVSNVSDTAEFPDLPDIPEIAEMFDKSDMLQKCWREYPTASKYLPPIKVIREKFVEGTRFDIIGCAVQVGDIKLRMHDNFCRAITEIILRDVDGDEMTLVMRGVSPVGDTLRCNSVLVGKNATVIFHEGNKQISCESRLLAVNPKTHQAYQFMQKFRYPVEAPAPKVDEESGRSESDDLSDQELLDMLLADKSMEIADEPMEMFSHDLPPNVDYTPIDVIHDTVPIGSMINVSGIVEDVGYSRCTNEKDGTFIDFKNVRILDNTQNSISMRICGRQAELVKERDIIIAAIDVKVHVEKNSKSLICLEDTSALYIKPRIDEVEELQEWDADWTIQNVVEVLSTITPNNRIFEKHQSGQTANVLGILIKKFDHRQTPGTPLGCADFVSRRIVLLDDSGVAIDVIMFDQAARDFIFTEGSILVIEKVTIDISGQNKACYCSSLTKFIVDPTEPEYQKDVDRLKHWMLNDNCREFRELLDSTFAHFFVGDVINSTMIGNNPAGISQSDDDEVIFEEQTDDDDAYISPDLFDSMSE